MIDFDAAVRDRCDPSIINPAYDDGDHLHFNLAGYQAMANAVNIALLKRATCTPPALKLAVTPSWVRAGQRTRLRFLVTVILNGTASRSAAP